MKDMTEQFQLSRVWFVKLFQVQDKLEARDRTKTDIFVLNQTTAQLFVSRTNCLKYQNSISSPKNRIKQKKKIQCYKNLSCAVMSCVVLFCLVLFCSVLTVLQTKRTLSWIMKMIMLDLFIYFFDKVRLIFFINQLWPINYLWILISSKIYSIVIKH